MKTFAFLIKLQQVLQLSSNCGYRFNFRSLAADKLATSPWLTIADLPWKVMRKNESACFYLFSAQQQQNDTKF